MPFGYLITVCVLALAVWSALDPRRRPPSVRAIQYRIGVGAGELPFVVLALLVAATALAFAEGDVDSAGAWVAVAIAALTAVGAGVIVRRSLATPPAVAAASAEGLGSRLAIRLPWARILLWPFPILRREVRIARNLSYGDAGRRNRLDLYAGRSRPEGGPILVYVHGGRFRSGRKSREARPLLNRLAARGWVCLSANYRLNPEASFPDQLVDLKKAIAWARANAPAHGGDPSRVFVAGSSAGAHMAAMAALTPGEPALQPGFERADTSVSGAICLYGYYGRLHTPFAPSSPLDCPMESAPPFFIAHGARDTIMSADGARTLAHGLRERSPSPVVYAELPGAQHGFDLVHSIRFEAVIDGIEALLERALAAPGDGTGQAEGAAPAGRPDRVARAR